MLSFGEPILKIFSLTIILALFFLYFSIHWNKIRVFFKLKSYFGLQRVHDDEVPRVAGLFIYLFLISSFFVGQFDNLILDILLSFLPLLVVSLREDIYYDVKPKARLISMFISIGIFFTINPVALPQIDIPYLGSFIAFFPINFLFFSFATVILINSMNIIDGINGLFAFTALSQLASLFFIAHSLNDIECMKIIFLLIIPLVVFIMFNFPLGKIFIGDLGAYFYGFSNSIIVIFLFGKYNNILLSWYAVIILFYPVFELIFTFIRRMVSGKKITDPDNLHLHSLIYSYLKNKNISNCICNFLTTIILSIFWTSPLIFLIYLNDLKVIFLILITLIFSYLLIYKLLNIKNEC